MNDESDQIYPISAALAEDRKVVIVP